jgi:CHAT domain-containing protein/tetratricopeptide (TPR) repeat protein
MAGHDFGRCTWGIVGCVPPANLPCAPARNRLREKLVRGERIGPEFSRLLFHTLSLVLAIAISLSGARRVSAQQASAAPTLTTDQQARLKERDEWGEEVVWLHNQGKLEEAIAALQKLLAIEREVFGDENEALAGSLRLLAVMYQSLDDFAAARTERQKILAIERKVHGEADWRTTDARLALADIDLLENLQPDERKQLHQADEHLVEVRKRQASGELIEAIASIDRVLATRRKLLGEEHRLTAVAWAWLGLLRKQAGDNRLADSLYRRALEIRKKALGELHPDYATNLHNLAALYETEGDYGRAEPLYRRALEIRKKALGEQHPDYAQCLNSLALLKDAQGDFASAEPLYRQALKIFKEAVGEQHPDYATGLNNLAALYKAQGDYARAEPLLLQALEIKKKAVGELHAGYATSLNNLALLYRAQGDYGRAEPLYRQALEIKKKAVGEQAPEYAECLNNVAELYCAQGDYGRAEPLFQQALVIKEKALGQQHPDYAVSLNNLAFLYEAQGDYARAEPLYQQALEIYKKALGEQHPQYATSLYNLALLYYARGEYARAKDHLERAAQTYEAARLAIAGDGMGRAFYGLAESPYRLLTATHARLADHTAAWTAAETNLARGMSDDAGARRGISPTGDEQARQRTVSGRLAEIQERIFSHVTTASLSIAETEDLAQLQQERSQLAVELTALAVTLSKRGLAELTEVERALPADGALVLWVDVSDHSGTAQVQEHWGCVVRRGNGATWERLPRTGPEDSWSDGDAELPRRLASAAANGAPAAEIADFARQLYAQRIAPLAMHLDGVRTLFVVPVGAMADVPIELVSDNYTVSYVPSGTFLAGRDRRRLASGNSLLALGNARFSHPAQPAEPSLPPALLTRHKAEQEIRVALRGGDWKELPGTAFEVTQLAALAGPDHATLLTHSQASEQALEQLRASGKLAEFRYLHFATHGELNNARAFESALILAQDQPSDEVPLDGGKSYDGRLTANEVLVDWQLDNAELVTLSACESALGRPGGGDGTLGFAQAFLLAGARSVCLSLWKVDDTATALLMDRFYQNLLGKREELSQPMGKAAALAEAKQWLRNLSREEATKLAADITKGVARGNYEPALKLVVPVPELESPAADDRPFSHPRFWAAFILIGDPD